MNILQQMLLIEEKSIFKLYQELMSVTSMLIFPMFLIGLILEYFGELNFVGVIKKLLIVTLFVNFFYGFHTKAVDLSLKIASETLSKVSPRNMFVQKWTRLKVNTPKSENWNILQKILVPNLNDLVATSFYVFSKVFIWLLKLIYSSVYHLTYVFAGITAVLYFLGWTKDALKGTVQASLWCMLMPFVVVAILALVGNSFSDYAQDGSIILTKIESIIWLFGVTLLLTITPVITYGMIRGEGIHSFGSKMGAMVTSAGMKTMMLYPLLQNAKNRVQSIGGEKMREPSIKELLQKEMGFDSKKSELLSKKGGVKLPFKKERDLSERLKEVGMTKEEAMKVVGIKTPRPVSQKTGASVTSSPSRQVATYGPLTPMKHSNVVNPDYQRLSRGQFKFNQKYWDNINPHKAQAIKQKYGINSDYVDQEKVHRPVKPQKIKAIKRRDHELR
jgi:hypothetical protein